MRLVCLWVFLIFIQQAFPNELWKNNENEISVWNPGKPRNFYAPAKLTNFRFEKCDESLEKCFNNEVNKLDNKRSKGPADYITSMPMEDPIISYFSPHHHKQPINCACGRVKELRDLGDNYFPRYISDMRCIPGGCGNYPCRSKFFKLWVMRRRQATDLEPGSEPVPIELREGWIAEPKLTTVDCECAP